MTEQKQNPVVFELRSAGEKQIGFATLNVEKSLNALSLEMIDLLFDQLSAWQQDDRVVCVMLQGAGDKAFCAGGDIRKLYDSMCETDGTENQYAVDFFSQEYRLDYLVHSFTKPIICWGQGIIMGGGVGLMAGASHRIVTESTRLAMPEINIGLYPDVGGSWFLARMPGKLGQFVGITACSLNAADALFAGFADRYMNNSEYQELCSALTVQEWSNDAEVNHDLVSKLLRRFEKTSLHSMPASPLRQHFDLINNLMDHSTLQESLDACLKVSSDDRWLQRSIKSFAAGCPTSIHLVREQIARCRHLSLAQVFQQELIVSVQCSALGEFREGVRALLIDKDNQPHWRHNCLDDVDIPWIDSHYQVPWGEAPHPLEDLSN